MPETRSQKRSQQDAPIMQVAATSQLPVQVATINWILFDTKRKPKPDIIDIPDPLFSSAAKRCQQLFADAILKIHHLQTDYNDIEFWRPNEVIPISTFKGTKWPESMIFDTLEDVATRIHLPESLSDHLEPLLRKNLHLIIKGEPDEMCDTITGLPEIQHYMKVLSRPGKTPSTAARSANYISTQKEDAESIFDGRQAPGGSARIAQPIQIFHPVFENFVRRLDDQSPLEKYFVRLVNDLVKKSSDIPPLEQDQAGWFRTKLSKLVDYGIHYEVNDDETKPDGVASITVNGDTARFLILEVKRGMGEGGCDAAVQACFSARRYWINQAGFKKFRDRCCCPTILLAVSGASMAIIGAIFTDRPIMQRLTEVLWVAQSSTQSGARVEYLARVVLALRESIKELAAYYKDIGERFAEIPAFRKEDVTVHPRFFPYPTSYSHETKGVVNFEYIQWFEAGDPTCVTFLAKTKDVAEQYIVVKFVATYGEEVHRLLAQNNYAPCLHYCGPLPGIEKDPLPDGTSRFRRLLPLMKMVVMEYMKPGTFPADRTIVRSQFADALTIMHNAGYVHGDLRKPNILFKDNRLKIIDFDWAGRYKANDQGHPVSPSPFIEPEYAHYPLNLNRSSEITWAKGVKDCESILPEHDKEMVDILLNETYAEL